MTRQGVPWLYGFSPSVIPAPADWPESAAVCGYWFTAADASWRPPEALVDFLRSGPAPVYVGFGSMVGSDPGADPADCSRGGPVGQESVPFSHPDGAECIMQAPAGPRFPVESVPHEWLFPQVAAAVHHGGAGTTAAALRAGIPSVVVPYFY